ncbi:MAG TPA: chromosome segregation protein SMC [Candidatus Binatia bacterium]|nr:chromosome segregation protein SMC [Candidatus Binatia bacterium]
MRLSSIKLAGFKSFVDPSALPLPSNLTSVVGPNGCGKSNIIDAVRWVLGESSMKQLRSDTMEDVIFNGSKTRKPAGRAAVELTFDNADGTVSGPYAAYSEIVVRRELTRDGTSQYYLNGAKCLKRDVTDLFLGTGLGARSGYAIIEQGMVSSMISSKPEELRQWIEEAAGISKYKERRRETETRIRQTRENLARLGDLRTELQGRLEVLRRQSANAEKYKEYKEQERRLKADLLAVRWRALSAQSDSQQAAIGELSAAVDAAREALSRAHEAQAGADNANRVAHHALAAQQNRVYESEGGLARQEQSLQHARELKAIKQRELEQAATQLAELSQREAAEQARLEELGRTLADLEAGLRTADAAEAQAQAAAQAAEQAAQAEQQRWDEFATRAETPLYQAEGERVRVQQLERGLADADERLSRLEGELGGLDYTPIQASLFDADSELENLNRELSDGQTRLQTLDRQVQELREARSAKDTALHDARQALQGARGRLASLETLQQAALRQDDAELQDWLRTQGLDDAPRLASVLTVEKGWEAAVEHVLGGLLQAPLLPGFAARLSELPSAPKVGVTLVDHGPEAAGRAADRLAGKVRGPAAVVELLESIFTEADSVAAVHRIAQLHAGESVVTADGVWRGRGWARYPRRDEDQGGVLERGVLLRELRMQVDAQGAAVEQHAAALAELQQRLLALESERRELASRFDTGRSRQAQRMAFRQAQAVRLEQTESRVRQLQQEVAELRASRDQQAADLEQGRRRLDELDAVARRLRDERAALQQALQERRDGLAQARAPLAQARDARHQAQVQLAGRNSTLEALRGTLGDLGSRRESLGAQRLQLEADTARLEAPLAEQAAAIEAARGGVENEREALRQARGRVEQAEALLAQTLQQAREAEFAQDAARERVQQAQLEFQGLAVRSQTLADQIGEAGFTRDELLAALPADATPEAWDEKVAAMARRIDRLGAINLAAIQELEESEGREKYLGDQNADLTGALETLEAAIRKIDIETRERFKTTFEQVDRTFRERFPKLFGGGEAYLELTGENLLETGVRVMARPPGKRNSSIQLLSGGEKAMTAVALLLALFELNPAPFCMLDEVDAPLDDANVSRFASVIRDMSDHVQFIIITHNKITMELAQQLHGVTMQEPGVSRLVSVDIQQAVDLASKRESAEAVA